MEKFENSSPKLPFFEEPVLCAACNGIPVNAYGYTYILEEAPDLLEKLEFQQNNSNSMNKVRIKKSWEISSNLLGGTPPRMPRSAHTDYQPLLPVHLIDGNISTCWCSKSITSKDAESVWIRIDFPVENEISRIVLRKLPKSKITRGQAGTMPVEIGHYEIGRSIPGHLSIRIACDACEWKVVFEGSSNDSPDKEEFSCEFSSQKAKQVWIIGSDLKKVENWLYSFSIASCEVFTPLGQNIALLSNGTGISVSSTYYGLGQTRDEHRWLWALHTDLGFKWVRIGYHDDPINWHWVEQEKGKLEVDSYADASIDYLLERGVNIIMCLAFGNRLYTQADSKRYLPQLWEWYYETPNPPTTPEALEAWARYVRFMVRRYGKRIKIFEIWNEWIWQCYWGGSVPGTAEQYAAIARISIPIIREECVDAQIMLCSLVGYIQGMASKPLEELLKNDVYAKQIQNIRDFAKDVDIIAWHPFYNPDPASQNFKNYVADIKELMKFCREHGFKGKFMVTEWSMTSANYPSLSFPACWGNYIATELQKAKIVASITVIHTALGLVSFFCETWDNYFPVDLTHVV